MNNASALLALCAASAARACGGAYERRGNCKRQLRQGGAQQYADEIQRCKSLTVGSMPEQHYRHRLRRDDCDRKRDPQKRGGSGRRPGVAASSRDLVMIISASIDVDDIVTHDVIVSQTR
jgi:hypothetical protein